MKMKEVEFANPQDVYDYFLDLNNKIPGRHENKHNERKVKKEIYCLEKTLVTFAQNDMLKFPIKVYQSESPDFIIQYPNAVRGLEVTEATNEEYQLWLANVCGKTGVYTFNEVRYFDLEPEKELSDFILERISKKESLLPKYHELHPEIKNCDLVIRQFMDCLIDNNELISILEEKFKDESKLPFRSISIVSGDELIYIKKIDKIKKFKIPNLSDA